MDLMSQTEAIVMLRDETDISIKEVKENKCFLEHSPMDVDASAVLLYENNMYLTVSTIVGIIGKEILGTSVQALYDENGHWTHICIS